ncbi:MAG: 4-hydroxy-tetrahydrodipicolinate reductase [Armatimonadia bacterium]
MSTTNPIRVLVTGVCGRMGSLVAKTIHEAPDMELVAAVDPAGVGHSLSEYAPGLPDLPVSGHLTGAIEDYEPEVLVDFTAPAVVMSNIKTALTAGVACVVGTTGFKDTDLQIVQKLCDSRNTPAIIAPNFSLGAVLMMKYAANAAKVFDYAEIIEYHHEMKKDSPSGTAVKTAEMMAEARGTSFESPATEMERVPGCRGGEMDGIRIHAVRLQGFVANQEVIFGGQGETLSIHHVTTSRESFMPGVVLAVRKVREQTGLVYGLEHVLDL